MFCCGQGLFEQSSKIYATFYSCQIRWMHTQPSITDMNPQWGRETCATQCAHPAQNWNLKVQPAVLKVSMWGDRPVKTTGHHTVTQGRGKFEPYLCLGSLQDKTRIYTPRDMVRKPEKHACWTKKTSNSTLISPPDLLLSSYDWKTDHVMQKYLKHYLRNAVWRQ